ncbi:MAG TPA: urea ABC transporter permease subunit UrtB, partial [Acetobacteraceae bacterium]|nr:urea ABC transporter permease subunit UrtB [Acetobacteraceae bacterium]
MCRCLRLLLIVLLVLAPIAGHADDADEAFADLASTNYDTIRHGVEKLAFSGHPQALSILSAMQGGLLYARTSDHALFIKTDSGAFLDATSGKAAPDVMASGLKQVRMNNPVRGEVDSALGSLRLQASDPAARMTAAEAVFHSHDPAAVPDVERALAKETDPAVKLRMQQARAAALLFSSDASEKDRLEAVAIIRARGDLDSRSLLDSLSGQPQAVAAAARAAVVAIDRVLELWSVAQSVYYGLSLGSVLLLAAAGLAITFGVMGVINMA